MHHIRNWVKAKYDVPFVVGSYNPKQVSILQQSLDEEMVDWKWLQAIKDLELEWIEGINKRCDKMDPTGTKKKQLKDWIATHKLNFTVPSIYKHVDFDDISISDDDFIVEVEVIKINPNDLTEIHHICLKYLDVDKVSYVVWAVYPVFDEASKVMVNANKTQDFVEFLIQCRKHWRDMYADMAEEDGYKLPALPSALAQIAEGNEDEDE